MNKSIVWTVCSSLEKKKRGKVENNKSKQVKICLITKTVIYSLKKKMKKFVKEDKDKNEYNEKQRGGGGGGGRGQRRRRKIRRRGETWGRTDVMTHSVRSSIAKDAMKLLVV